MRPKLIHPIDVVLKNVDKSGTTYDDDFDEPSGDVVYGTAFTISGQVRLNKFNRFEGNITGFEYKGDGYVLVTKADATKIEINAMITTIDGESVEYYVLEKAPSAHYEHSNFKRIYFESKDKN